MGSDWELDALASLELGLDEGADGVDREEHEQGHHEPVEEVEAWVSQLIADGFDAHVGDVGQIDVGKPSAATGLAPLVGRVNDGILKETISHAK